MNYYKACYIPFGAELVLKRSMRIRLVNNMIGLGQY
jgi:hypothetical protein